MSKKEMCIMKPDVRWSTQRFEGSHRHEIFYGTANRQKSIENMMKHQIKNMYQWIYGN